MSQILLPWKPWKSKDCRVWLVNLSLAEFKDKFSTDFNDSRSGPQVSAGLVLIRGPMLLPMKVIANVQ